MSKLLPGLAIGLSLAVFPLASIVLPAFAKDQTVTVNIGGDFAIALAAATGVAVEELPDTVVVPKGVANNVCGEKVEAGETCDGVAEAELLADYLAGDDDDTSSSSVDPSTSSSEEPNENSAKAFAPGQIKGDDESAKIYAPGQTKEDGESAKEEAPGQQKGGDDNGKK
jgi:hypothetical protein